MLSSTLARLLETTDVDEQLAHLVSLSSEVHFSTSFNTSAFLQVMNHALATCNPQVTLQAMRVILSALETHPDISSSMVSSSSTMEKISSLAKECDLDITESCIKILDKLAIQHSAIVQRYGGADLFCKYIHFFAVDVQRICLNGCRKFSRVSDDCLAVFVEFLDHFDDRVSVGAYQCLGNVLIRNDVKVGVSAIEKGLGHANDLVKGLFLKVVLAMISRKQDFQELVGCLIAQFDGICDKKNILMMNDLLTIFCDILPAMEGALINEFYNRGCFTQSVEYFEYDKLPKLLKKSFIMFPRLQKKCLVALTRIVPFVQQRWMVSFAVSLVMEQKDQLLITGGLDMLYYVVKHFPNLASLIQRQGFTKIEIANDRLQQRMNEIHSMITWVEYQPMISSSIEEILSMTEFELFSLINSVNEFEWIKEIVATEGDIGSLVHLLNECVSRFNDFEVKELKHSGCFPKTSTSLRILSKPIQVTLEGCMRSCMIVLPLTSIEEIDLNQFKTEKNDKKFMLNDQIVPPNMTIFEAVHKFGNGNLNEPVVLKVELSNQISRSVVSTSKFLVRPMKCSRFEIESRVKKVLNVLCEIQYPHISINLSLSSKLHGMLNEPLIFCSQIPSCWRDLVIHFRFLFPFEQRFFFFVSSYLGKGRAVREWVKKNNISVSVGRLQRHKAVIERSNWMPCALKILEMIGVNICSSSILEIEYSGEAGVGLGPSLEFYSITSDEFASLNIWRKERMGGLFPAVDVDPDNTFHLFYLLGKFVAKAVLDFRRINLYFNPVFVKLIRNEHIDLNLSTLSMVDSVLAKSLENMKSISNIHELAIDFTLPGYDILLSRDNSIVCEENLNEYISSCIEWTLFIGIQRQVDAFVNGFNSVIDITGLSFFDHNELDIVLRGVQESWTEEYILKSIKVDHGYTPDSLAILNLVKFMASLDMNEQCLFIRFITGHPALPIGGLKSLNPPLTIVKKYDNGLPSVMTCVNYLKLPDYGNYELLCDKFRIAMHDGQSSFHLS